MTDPITSPEASLVELTTTVGTHETAIQIATQIVAKHLAACVQIAGPLTSVYVWEQKLEQTQEWSVQFKTCESKLIELIDAVCAIHPYQLPELKWRSVQTTQTYRDWVEHETKRVD